jgi:hypothetical protein
MGALAMGQSNIKALRSSKERRSLIESARKDFIALIEGAQVSKAACKGLQIAILICGIQFTHVSLSTVMRDQCVYLLSDEDLSEELETALFEPWANPFFVESTSLDHNYQPQFFSKFTWYAENLIVICDLKLFHNRSQV